MARTYQRRGLVGLCAYCSGKLLFATRGDADRYLKRKLRESRKGFDPENMEAYRCPVVARRGFHIGHKLRRFWNTSPPNLSHAT